MGHIPMDVMGELDILAPMLRKLGYDTTTDVPTYGVADQVVLNNMKQLKDNAEFWEAKAKSYARQALNISNTVSNGSPV